MRFRPASRSTSRCASSATRSRMPPTERHATRISCATAVLEQCTAKPRGLILECPGQARPMPRPRHRADHDPMARARDPRRVGLDERRRRAQVQRAPAPPPLAEVEPRRPAPADTKTVALTPVRPGGHDDLARLADPHILDHSPAQPEQPRPYPDTAHVVSPPSESSLRTAGNLGGKRRAHHSSAHINPRQRQERRISARVQLAPVGANRDPAGNRRTLDEYLKQCVKRQTANYVAVVLEQAKL